MIGSSTSCSNKEYPVNNSSYSTTQSMVGCTSKYNSSKKEEIFNTQFKDHWMTWGGTVVAPKADRISLDVDGGSQDLIVKFKDKKAGFDLQGGEIIRVRFLMKSAGGCFLPYSGKEAEILQ